MLIGLIQRISDATQLVQADLVYYQYLVEQVDISLTTITLAQNSKDLVSLGTIAEECCR